MESVLMGLLVSLLIGVPVFLIGWGAAKLDCKPLIVICCVVATVITCSTVYSSRQDSLAWAAGFEAKKVTIETSLKIDSLTGFERAQLVQQAADANMELGEKQYYTSRWYGFDSSDYVLTLEPVSLEG